MLVAKHLPFLESAAELAEVIVKWKLATAFETLLLSSSIYANDIGG